ncbi:thiopurine S-methyltransferase [Steroidobacter denitrificans]|uniref:Thiopurine S-methyltransferase n=1 Tax=Steroidobacter denitrificans TaxID=465721 RepID=A0A127FDU6_STEDE|nr:thiopurine S-methyltransferase [Steroidobacter denitrificans]AMN47818.1 thiopurine S-methyltransferase [Steroidobacter denitrificans]
MDLNFWLERWAKHETGFHQQQTNPHLQKYWPQLGVPAGATVFVPLCGKSLDMLWLQQQGHPVLGVEVARTAVSDFFTAWRTDVHVAPLGDFEQWSAGGAQGITVLCGDFFALDPTSTVHVGAVFDRAALIALPPQMRHAYVHKLLGILPAQVPMLLITLDYRQEEMPGPPFAVSDREVRQLFAALPVECLDEIDVTAAAASMRFRQRGVSRMLERVYRIGDPVCKPA